MNASENLSNISSHKESLQKNPLLLDRLVQSLEIRDVHVLETRHSGDISVIQTNLRMRDDLRDGHDHVVYQDHVRLFEVSPTHVAFQRLHGFHHLHPSLIVCQWAKHLVACVLFYSVSEHHHSLDLLCRLPSVYNGVVQGLGSCRTVPIFACLQKYSLCGGV